MTNTNDPRSDGPAEPAWGEPPAPPATPAATPVAAPTDASNLVAPSAPVSPTTDGAAWSAQPITIAGSAVALIHLRPEETYQGSLVAPAGKRILAFFIDTVLAWAVTAAGLFAGIVAFGNGTGGVPALGFGLLGLYFLVLIVIVARTGLTVGKAVVGLRVVNATSLKPIGLGAALVRGILIFPLSLLLVWMLLLLISALALDHTGRNQGWHDKAARAIVVDTRRGADPMVNGTSAAPLARAV